MLLSIQPVKIPEKITVFLRILVESSKIPEKITVFLRILVESSIFSMGRAKMPKNGVLIH